MTMADSPVEQWSVSDLAALYEEHRNSLVRLSQRILRSEADALEVVQEAFMKFILAAPSASTCLSRLPARGVGLMENRWLKLSASGQMSDLSGQRDK